MPLSSQLREAIEKSHLSLRQLAKAAGVSQPVLSHFISTDTDFHRDIRLERTADKLAAYFNLVLVEDKDAKPAKKSARQRPPSTPRRTKAAKSAKRTKG